MSAVIVNQDELYSMVKLAFSEGKFDRYHKIDIYVIKSVLSVDFAPGDSDTEKCAQDLATHFTDRLYARKFDEAKQAAKVLYDMLNRGDKEFVVKALQDHRYLMNEMGMAVMESMNRYARFNRDEFDGRISPIFQGLIKDYFPYNR